MQRSTIGSAASDGRGRPIRLPATPPFQFPLGSRPTPRGKVCCYSRNEGNSFTQPISHFASKPNHLSALRPLPGRSFLAIVLETRTDGGDYPEGKQSQSRSLLWIIQFLFSSRPLSRSHNRPATPNCSGAGGRATNMAWKERKKRERQLHFSSNLGSVLRPFDAINIPLLSRLHNGQSGKCDKRGRRCAATLELQPIPNESLHSQCHGTESLCLVP